jgi:hypothetical protein
MTMLLQPPHWTELARCAETDPETFFPEPGGSAEPAKQVCAGCEVRETCLAYALEHSLAGVWGGTSERERQRMTGRRPALTAVPPAAVGEKPCTKCGAVKPMAAFGADRALPGGRKYWCKACFAAYRADRERAAA